MGDLFEVKWNPQLNKDSFEFEEFWEYPYFTRTVFNNWILGYVKYLDEEHKIKWNCLAIWMMWMQFFYMDKDFYAGQFTKRIIPKWFSLNTSNANFFISLLNKLQPIFQNTLVRHFEKTFNETKISLPIKNWEINFAFMEKFMRELESERLRELEAYLLATWLKDYELTTSEQQVLHDFEDGKFEWRNFQLGELFEVNSYKKRFDANKVFISEIWNPYIVRTSLNNWLRWYINEKEEFLNDGNTISFGQDTATMFYQEKPYFTGDKIKILKSKNKQNKFNKKNAQFFISTMTRSFSSFSWWNSSFSIKVISKQEIQLPTKDNKPDYHTMETFISAIQKLVIKDVVLFTYKKLKATKEVIDRG